MGHGVSSDWCRSHVYRQRVRGAIDGCPALSGQRRRLLLLRRPDRRISVLSLPPSAAAAFRGTRLAERGWYTAACTRDRPARGITHQQGNAMTDRHDSSRRRALAQLSAGSLATLAPWAIQAALAQAKPLTVGVIYVGPRDDFGYNQAQAQAVAEVKKLPGVKVVEEENVPETTAVQK